MKLSILIPTIRRHTRKHGILCDQIWRQMRPYMEQVEVLSDDHETDSIGRKRNRLLDRARGEYICFIDADDRISDNYLAAVMEGIEKKVDCCSLKGIITTNGKHPALFEHSIKYKEYLTNQGAVYESNEIKYERFPNHLNCISSEIAKLFRFRDKSHGEDTDWATLIHRSGLISSEHYIPEVIYFYDYETIKNV